MKKIWFVSLCMLLIISTSCGLSIPLRIAIGANAVVIIMDIIWRVRGLKDGTAEEKN